MPRAHTCQSFSRPPEVSTPGASDHKWRSPRQAFYRLGRLPLDTHDSYDFIWGAENIAAFIGRSVRSTYHMLENELIPAEQIGALWVVHRTTLRRHLGAIPPDPTDDEADE